MTWRTSHNESKQLNIFNLWIELKEKLFASGSSDGNLILWESDTLLKYADLKPFDELNRSDHALRFSLTSISCVKSLYEVCKIRSSSTTRLVLEHEIKKKRKKEI